MNGLNLCTVLIRCHKCENDIKVKLQNIADEEIITCTCGTEIQLMDFGRAIHQMLENGETVKQEELVESDL